MERPDIVVAIVSGFRTPNAIQLTLCMLQVAVEIVDVFIVIIWHQKETVISIDDTGHSLQQLHIETGSRLRIRVLNTSPQIKSVCTVKMQ